MQPEILTWLIPLPPILAFGLIVLFTNRNNRLSHSIAVGAMLISWATAMAVFWTAINTEHLGQHPIESAIAWLPVGENTLEIGILIDPLSAIALFFVAWTCLAILFTALVIIILAKPATQRINTAFRPKRVGLIRCTPASSLSSPYLPLVC